MNSSLQRVSKNTRARKVIVSCPKSMAYDHTNTKRPEVAACKCAKNTHQEFEAGPCIFWIRCPPELTNPKSPNLKIKNCQAISSGSVNLPIWVLLAAGAQFPGVFFSKSWRWFIFDSRSHRKITFFRYISFLTTQSIFQIGIPPM